MIDWDKTVLGPVVGVFGEPVTYLPAAGGSFAITAVFDRPYHGEVILEDGSPEVTMMAPVLGVQLSQFASVPVQGDKLSIPSVNTTYIVREVRLDGHGYAKLMLNKVSSP